VAPAYLVSSTATFALAGPNLLSAAAGLIILFAWIRRLHDIGQSGWLAGALYAVIACLVLGSRGFLPAENAAWLATVLPLGVIVVLGCIPGQPEANAYGRPRGREAGTAPPMAAP
jgi:uncharacterized membrane protein YhaH (DUF805 family)